MVVGSSETVYVEAAGVYGTRSATQIVLIAVHNTSLHGSIAHGAGFEVCRKAELAYGHVGAK